MGYIFHLLLRPMPDHLYIYSFVRFLFHWLSVAWMGWFSTTKWNAKYYYFVYHLSVHKICCLLSPIYTQWGNKLIAHIRIFPLFCCSHENIIFILAVNIVARYIGIWASMNGNIEWSAMSRINWSNKAQKITATAAAAISIRIANHWTTNVLQFMDPGSAIGKNNRISSVRCSDHYLPIRSLFMLLRNRFCSCSTILVPSIHLFAAVIFSRRSFFVAARFAIILFIYTCEKLCTVHNICDCC